MPVMRITNRAVEALSPGAKSYIAYDADLKGFGVRVMPAKRDGEGPKVAGNKEPSGKKSWIIEYRPGAGGRGCPKRRYKFGEVGVLSADKARAHAQRLLAEVRLGGDPAAQAKAERKQLTLAELIDEYLTEIEARLKPRTAAFYRDILIRLVKPELGSRKVDAITRPMLSRLRLSLKDTPYQANHMLAVVKAMFSYAEAHHVVPEGFNPARRIPKFPESARERFLTNEELDRLGAALREAETVGIPWEVDLTTPTAKHLAAEDKRRIRFSPHAVGAVRLLLFTGCRLREILGLEWAHVDLDRGLLFLPDSKTGRKTVVLNAPAMAVLASLPRIGRYVIAGAAAGSKDEKPRADLRRPWETVCRRASIKGVRIHDLRHTHASIAAAGGLGLPVIGKLLGHKQAATTARYAHLDIDPQRRFIGARLIESMGEVPAGSPAAEVIPLRPKAS